MNVELRQITALEEALELAPHLEPSARDMLADVRDGDAPEGLARRALERHVPDPLGLLLVAEDGERGVLGALLGGPFLDPLTLEETPGIVLLWTHPNWRHRGIARQLVARARKLYLDRDQPVFQARAGHNDDARISMGERMGFVRTWEWMALE